MWNIAQARPGQAAAEQVASRCARRDLPDHGIGEPTPPALAAAIAARKHHGEQHEGEGQPVIQPGLRGEGKADLILLPGVRPPNLNVASQNWVGRCEAGGQEDGGGGA
jgi:hypothetical protein